MIYETPTPYHTAFYGHYVNMRNEKMKIYLGFSFKKAFLDVNDKKIVLVRNFPWQPGSKNQPIKTCVFLDKKAMFVSLSHSNCTHVFTEQTDPQQSALRR